MQRLLETPDLFVSLVLGPAVAFLQLARELLLVAVKTIEIVIGELAPLVLQRAFQLLPLALDDVLVNGRTSLQLGSVAKAIMDARGGNRRRPIHATRRHGNFFVAARYRGVSVVAGSFT